MSTFIRGTIAILMAIAAVAVGELLLAASTAQAASNFETIFNFGSVHHTGGAPQWRVIIDQKGAVYGTTNTGGLHHGLGTVYQLIPRPHRQWKFNRLHT